MNVTITSINQNYSLNGGQVTFTATVQLPSGKVLTVPLSEEETNAILVESQTPEEELEDLPSAGLVDLGEEGSDQLRVSVDTEVVETPVDVVDQYEHHVEEGVVEWEKLPDTQLPPQMKGYLRKAGVNKFLSMEDLNALKSQILESMAKKPKVGKVNWNEGQKREGAGGAWASFRTVPKDEHGNPRPPGGIVEADPGEGADDDDGVAQL